MAIMKHETMDIVNTHVDNLCDMIDNCEIWPPYVSGLPKIAICNIIGKMAVAFVPSRAKGEFEPDKIFSKMSLHVQKIQQWKVVKIRRLY